MTDSRHTEPSDRFSQQAIDHSAADDQAAGPVSTADQLTVLMDEDDIMDKQLDRVPTRRLRAMINRVFKDLDSPQPPAGAHIRYDTLLEVLEERARAAARCSTHVQVRESLRDNTLYRRFELRIDGTLAAQLNYRLRAGRITLTDGVEHPEFRDQGVAATLLRHVLLNTHKRRLSLIPQCPMVATFLIENPQYQVLAALDAAPSAHLHS